MRSLYLLNLNGYQYAVWKDAVGSVREISTIHQLPFSPPGIAGIAVVDKTSTALADLAALIGLPPFERDSKGQLLLVAGQKNDAGRPKCHGARFRADMAGHLRDIATVGPTGLVEISHRADTGCDCNSIRWVFLRTGFIGIALQLRFRGAAGRHDWADRVLVSHIGHCGWLLLGSQT